MRTPALQPPKHETFSILLALDLADTSGSALDEAAHLARRVPSAELHVVYVAPETTTKKHLLELAEGLQLYVADKAAAIGGLAGRELGIHVRVGDAAHAITEVATEVDAAVIVLASRSKTRVRSPFRAPRLARELLAHAPCPVVIAGAKPAEVSHAARIEPPCADCLEARAATNGRVQWCERHEKRHGVSHVYSYAPATPFESHDSEVIPTGIGF